MKPTVKIVIVFAWWWAWLYMPGVGTLCLLGLEPDPEKFCRVAMKAMRVRVVPWRGIEA